MLKYDISNYLNVVIKLITVYRNLFTLFDLCAETFCKARGNRLAKTRLIKLNSQTGGYWLNISFGQRITQPKAIWRGIGRGCQNLFFFWEIFVNPNYGELNNVFTN